MPNKFYRPDIDGLRAIAVVLVLLFHGGLSFTGGFIGVDVFFVISGFLITGLIIRQQKEGKFSLSEFWSRRIRRIIPASAVVAITTLIAGAFLLFPQDFNELGKSAIAQQMMLSNVFFWQNTGYFQGPADVKPLLHTWSLAVEEQFYLFYPFVLILMARLSVRFKVITFSVVILGSLVLSEWGAYRYPSATFYLLPTRIWELLLGGILCFLPERPIKNMAMSHGIALCGLAMILFASLTFNSTTRFPGFSAALPCFGTALIIISNTGKLNIVGRFLAYKPVVFVGLISYSLYLWHWPILAYARYWLGHDLPLNVVLLSLTLSFVLACLSWKYVETPLRRSRNATYRRPILIGICTSIPFIIILSGVVSFNRGFPDRVSKDVIEYLAASESRSFVERVSVEQAQNGRIPVYGDPKGKGSCLVWGDSHAIAIMPGVDAACKQLTLKTFQATHPSTPPLLEFIHIGDYGLREKSPLWSEAVIEFVKNEKVDVAILTGKWHKYAEQPAFEKSLALTIDRLNSCGCHAIIMLDIANQNVDVPLALAQKVYWGRGIDEVGVEHAAHQKINRHCDEIIHRVVQISDNASVIDPSKLFVNQKGRWKTVIDGKVMFRDAHHLTIEGGLHLKSLFKTAISRTKDLR